MLQQDIIFKTDFDMEKMLILMMSIIYLFNLFRTKTDSQKLILTKKKKKNRIKLWLLIFKYIHIFAYLLI